MLYRGQDRECAHVHVTVPLRQTLQFQTNSLTLCMLVN